jgi:SAM-dependent methyltransferase
MMGRPSTLRHLLLTAALVAGGAGGAAALDAPRQLTEQSPFSSTLGIHNLVPPNNKKRVFEGPDRLRHLQVERVAEAMALTAGQRVLDFGAGSGVFTFPMARQVGPKGSVVATEIQAGLLTMLQADAAKQGLTWVEPVQGSLTDPAAPIRGRTFDVALLSAVYEFLPSPADFAKDLRAAMVPGGKVFIIHPKLVWDFNPYNPPSAAVLADLGAQTRFQHPLLRRLSSETIQRLQAGDWERDLPTFQEKLLADLNRILEDQSFFLDVKAYHAAAKRDKDAIFRILHPQQGQLISVIFSLYPEVFLYSARRPSATEAFAIKTVNWLLVRALVRDADGQGGAGFARSLLVSPEEITETMEQGGFKAARRFEFLPYYDFLEFEAK